MRGAFGQDMVSAFCDVVGDADDVNEEHGDDLWVSCVYSLFEVPVGSESWFECWGVLVGDVEDVRDGAGFLEDVERGCGEGCVCDGVGEDVCGGSQVCEGVDS